MKDILGPLDAYEWWMVKCNIEYIKEQGIEVAAVVNQLQAGGYKRVADAVAAAVAATGSGIGESDE